MTELTTKLDENEQEVVDKWEDSNLLIFERIECKCYLLSVKGKYGYEECFGKTTSEIEKKQKYNLARPKKVIKYYNYYLLENQDEDGEWYIGEMQSNGNIEFYKCCSNLDYAFQSL